jgi:hypothetical protein
MSVKSIGALNEYSIKPLTREKCGLYTKGEIGSII